MRQPKTPADQATVAEQLAHLLRQGVGGNIEVLGLKTQQQIADAAADQEGLESRLAQAIQHAQCVLGDVCTGNRVVGPRNNPGLYGWCRGVNR